MQFSYRPTNIMEALFPEQQDIKIQPTQTS